jgi:hypothetical protein
MRMVSPKNTTFVTDPRIEALGGNYIPTYNTHIFANTHITYSYKRFRPPPPPPLRAGENTHPP